MWRGRSTRQWTCQLRQRSAAKRSATPDKDKKQVNMVRRALSFNRKPRRGGADGGEFTALLEGTAEDREARLLARRQATARTIERVSGAIVGVAIVSGNPLPRLLHPAGKWGGRCSHSEW